MAKGFEQAKLDDYVDQAHEDAVTNGSAEWKRVSGLLEQVQRRLEHATYQALALGGETGPAASKAFAKSATAMGDKAGQLREGSEALRAAAAAIAYGRGKRAELGQAGPRPSSPEPLAPGATDKEIAKHGQQQSAVSAWEQDQERRERIARETTTSMDADFRKSTAVMKKIHGEPDPVPKPTDQQGPGSTTTPGGPGGRTRSPYDNGGRTGTNNNNTSVITSTNNDDSTNNTQTTSNPPPNTDIHYPVADEGDMSAEPSGSSQGSWTGSDPSAPAPGALTGGGGGSTTPATSVGAGAGITGGAGLLGGAAMGGLGGNMGGIRGGLTPVSTSSSGVRPIGSTARSATTGTLGRGSTPVGTGNGSGGSGRAGGGRSTTGGRGAAGGRGGAGGATGRGGDRSKGSKKSERDHMDEEWEIDDEDAAPSVLD